MESFFEPVAESLKLVEDRMRAQTEGYHPELGAALNHLLSSGGKRIRPAVTLLAGGVIGGELEKSIIMGAAVELLHTATLVHDDLIDESLMRRGNPTLNARWSAAATVLTGDFLFARAAKLASELDSPPALRLFAETLAIIVNGELTQMFTSRGKVSREDYYRRIYAKTASLFETATTSVAMLCSADDELLNKMRQYGYEIGMAFQMVDDILDFNGEQARVGKPVANDLRQGLVTLPALYYLEAYPDDANMQTVLHAPRCDEDCYAHLLYSIRKSGAIQQAADEARQYVRRGIAAITDFPPSEYRQGLMELAEYIVDRKF